MFSNLRQHASDRYTVTFGNTVLVLRSLDWQNVRRAVFAKRGVFQSGADLDRCLHEFKDPAPPQRGALLLKN